MAVTTTTKAEQKVSVSGEHITVRDLREFVRQLNEAPDDAKLVLSHIRGDQRDPYTSSTISVTWDPTKVTKKPGLTPRETAYFR